MMYLIPSSQLKSIEIESVAPVFTLEDQKYQLHRLVDYQGQWVVLYFYPRDNTPGCIKEACQFRDNLEELKELNTIVIGISTDNPVSHASFASKYGLSFLLLSDKKGEVAKQYGSLWSLGPIKFARRQTFIISPEGIVKKIYRKVIPEIHSREIIRDLKQLQQ